MTVPVGVVVDLIDTAHPGRSPAAVDNLLFLCQGHHVGRFLEPLFLNMFDTVESGAELAPEADVDEYTVEPTLSERERTVVDEVLTRYGHLGDDVLTGLVCATWPCQEARHGGWLIAPEVIRDDFLRTLPEVGTATE